MSFQVLVRPIFHVHSSSETMAVGKKTLTKEEELLLQDFSRNVSTKSSALFYGNAFIVSVIPICKLKFHILTGIGMPVKN